MNKNGKTLVENIIIVSTVSIILTGVVGICSGYLKDSTTKKSCNMVDKVYVEGSRIGTGTCTTK